MLDAPGNMIKTHDSAGAAAAARHLATLGHTRIAHIRGPPTFRSSHERLRGFEAGLAESASKLDPKLVLEGAYTFESGVACAQQLLERPPAARPTAVFAGNDEMAVGVYQAARRAGFGVPEILSIVGFDDTPMASRIWPPLTTVRLPIREMGKAAAALLRWGARGACGSRRVRARDHRAAIDGAGSKKMSDGTSVERPAADRAEGGRRV